MLIADIVLDTHCYENYNFATKKLMAIRHLNIC